MTKLPRKTRCPSRSSKACERMPKSILTGQGTNTAETLPYRADRVAPLRPLALHVEDRALLPLAVAEVTRVVVPVAEVAETRGDELVIVQHGVQRSRHDRDLGVRLEEHADAVR